MAPLVKKLQTMPEQFQTIVCVTGQHREMLDQVLRLFDITPDYDLNIMKPNQDLYDITSRILLGMRDVLREITVLSPDLAKDENFLMVKGVVDSFSDLYLSVLLTK